MKCYKPLVAIHIFGWFVVLVSLLFFVVSEIFKSMNNMHLYNEFINVAIIIIIIGLFITFILPGGIYLILCCRNRRKRVNYQTLDDQF